MSESSFNCADPYQSPFDEETERAVGRLILAWSVSEWSMCQQVAKLIALQRHPVSLKFEFCVPAYLKAAMATPGTAMRASLVQIQNLLESHAIFLKPTCDALLALKTKRDAVAHHLSGPAGPGKIRLSNWGLSRAKGGKQQIYSVKDLNNWANQIKNHSRRIDTIVTEETGWTWAKMQESQNKWTEDKKRLGDGLRLSFVDKLESI